MTGRQSDRLLIDRSAVRGILALPQHFAYDRLPMTIFGGKVRMADVRTVMRRAARNGAEWHGGQLVRLSGGMFGVSDRSLFYYIKKHRAPHFRISRKVALVERDYIQDFLIGKNRHSRKVARYGEEQ